MDGGWSHVIVHHVGFKVALLVVVEPKPVRQIMPVASVVQAFRQLVEMVDLQ